MKTGTFRQCLFCGESFDDLGFVGCRYCSLACEQDHRYSKVGKICGSCGEEIYLTIANIYGGEEEILCCGCEIDY